MEISNELKDNLIADVENILAINISDENSELLKRCFEITIGHAISALSIPQPERKMAEEMTEDEMDLIQYVTNLLYFARNETSEFANIEFDRWVEDQTTNLREYAAQGIASENTIPYIKSEHDHQLPRIAKIIGKDKFVFEQSINALLYIIETQGIDWPSEEESNKILDKKAFRVPYDGSDNFYDESFIKGWKACYEWLLNRVKQGKEVSNEPEPCKSCKNKAPENCSTCKVINGHLDGV